MNFLLVTILTFILIGTRRKGVFLVLSERGEMIKRKWGHLTGVASVKWGVPENVIVTIIGIESDGNPNLVGNAKEIGLMQLLPSTFSDYEKENERKNTSAFNPVFNIDAGSWYLSKINQAFPLEAWEEKMKAYNTGIEGHRKGRKPLDSWTSRFNLFMRIT